MTEMTKDKNVPVTQEKRNYTNGNSDSNVWVPPVDIYETKDAVQIVADLPGVEKDAVDLNVEHGTLTIMARATALSERTSVYAEYEARNYQRQFRLGEEVDQEKIHAELKNGVLRVTLPKTEKVKPKQIKVNVN